jgi:hypothetical protein
MTSCGVKATLGAPYALHLVPVFTLRLSLLESQLLEEDVGGIENTTRVTSVGTLVTVSLLNKINA